MPDAPPPVPPPRLAASEWWAALVGIAAVTAAVFVPSLLDPEACGKFDVYRAFGPWSYFFDRSIQSGEFPAWNPLTLGGAPFAANPQSWALYPPNILRALLHVQPTPRGTLGGLAMLALLHVVLLGVGTYRLARAHELSRSAAALAMLGASLNALIVRRVAELHFVFTLAWLPWMLLHTRAFVRAQSPRERLHHGTWLACYGALAVLGGFPQLYPYLAAGVLAYAAVERLTDPRVQDSRVQGSRARGLGALLARDVGYALPAALLMLGLAACLLLPAEHFARHSGRIANAKHAADGHLPEAWTLRYAWRAMCVYSGKHYEPETLRGAGVGVLALASAGVLAGISRTRVSLLAALYVFVDLLIGTPMPIASALALVSPFQMVSATRAADVGLLFFALLAGCGLDALRSATAWRRGLALAAVVVLGGAALGTLHHQIDAGRVWVEISSFVQLVPLTLLAMCVVVALVPRSARGARVLPAALVLLVACELLAWNGPYARALIVHRHFQRDWLSHTDTEGKNPLWPDNRRHADERPNFDLFSLRGVMNGYDPLHLQRVRQFVASGARSRRYERTVFADEPLAKSARGHQWMKRAFWLVPSVVVGPQPPRRSVYPPTEVAFVRTRPALVPVREAGAVLGRGVARDATRTAVELLSTRRLRAQEGMSRVRIATHWVTIPAQHAVLELTLRARGRVEISPTVQRAFHEGYVPSEAPALHVRVESATLTEHRVEIPLPDWTTLRTELELRFDDPELSPELLSIAVLSDPHDEDGKLQIVARSANEVRVRVRELPAPRLLAFSDAFYSGWHAEVDGKPAAILRTADVFKGVELPPGSHDVRFYFAPGRLRLGLWLSAIALLLAAAVLLRTRA